MGGGREKFLEEMSRHTPDKTVHVSPYHIFAATSNVVANNERVHEARDRTCVTSAPGAPPSP